MCSDATICSYARFHWALTLHRKNKILREGVLVSVERPREVIRNLKENIKAHSFVHLTLDTMCNTKGQVRLRSTA